MDTPIIRRLVEEPQQVLEVDRVDIVDRERIRIDGADGALARVGIQAGDWMIKVRRVALQMERVDSEQRVLCLSKP